VAGGPALFPSASFRLTGGEVEISRTVGDLEVLTATQSPTFMPDDSAGAVRIEETPAFLRAVPPDTVRLGPQTYLLQNPGYREIVTLIADTVFVLDATQGEARARQDSAWIGKLFPGAYPIVVIVTDVAWPHIGGLRFWVASGAMVVSHRASRNLLERVVEHQWLHMPDLLEQRRDRATFIFRPVGDTLSLGDGRLRIIPVDGIGSEGALVVYLPDAGLLWASDYIQNTRRPSLYTLEVWRAVRRHGIMPARTVAQHVDVTPWSAVDALVRRLDEGDAP